MDSPGRSLVTAGIISGRRLATNTSDPVTVSDTGLVTVTGLGDGVDSDVRLTANRRVMTRV